MNITLRSSLLCFCFLLIFVVSNFGQSKVEYGIGIGINHSRLDEDITTTRGPGPRNYKGLRLPAIMTRIGYKINEEFHINTGPGFSWLGSLERNFSSRIVATTFEVPLQLEWNVRLNIHLSTGPLYNYIIGISNENEVMDYDMLPLVNSRHQVGLKHGISFSHHLLELSLNYSHYFTNVFNFAFSDANGNFVGNSISKFGNIQLGIIFRK